jgi:hypothetical protein
MPILGLMLCGMPRSLTTQVPYRNSKLTRLAGEGLISQGLCEPMAVDPTQARRRKHCRSGPSRHLPALPR